MADFIIWLLETQPAWVMIVGIMGFLAAEFLLDIVKDLVIDWIRERRKCK